MPVEIHSLDSVTVLSITGDVDAASSVELAPVFTELLQEGRRRFVIDLSGVPFMDSSGLAFLVMASNRVRSASGSLRLCGVQEQLQGVLELTRLDRMFDIFPDAAAATSGWR